MAITVLNTIEYLVLIVSGFAERCNISEAQAYAYLSDYGAMALCEKHYGVMHTLSVEDNIDSLINYCRRKGGTI